MWAYSFHNGSSCQFVGNPIALMSIIGKSVNKCCRCSFISLCGDTISINHFMIQISKNVLLGETEELTHGREGFLVIIGVIGFSLFHTLA